MLLRRLKKFIITKLGGYTQQYFTDEQYKQLEAAILAIVKEQKCPAARKNRKNRKRSKNNGNEN